ncbi:hypothetical protein [Rhizobium sp. 21-4511-3d]
MRRWISGRDYAVGAAIRFGAFLAITVGFPFFVYGIVMLSGAQGTGGAAGALALVLGLYLKPVIYLIFAFSLLSISIRRARSLEISLLIGICISLLVLSDLAFGITFGSFWAVGFSLGMLTLPMPASVFTAVMAIATLSLLKDSDELTTDGAATLYKAWKTLLFVSTALGLLGLLPYLSIWLLGSSGLALAAARVLFYLRSALVYPYGLLLIFAGVSVALVIASRRTPPAGSRPSSRSPSASRAPMFGRQSQ